MEPACRLDCKALTTKDYTDLLWTTVAEFPGNLCLLYVSASVVDIVSTRAY